MNTKSKSGPGCGTGCLSLIIILVLFFAGSYFFIKHRLDSLNKIDESEEKIETIYGSVYEFTPDLDLLYNSERVVRFLEIRSTISSEMNELDSALAGMQNDIDGIVEDPSFWDAITIIKSGFELIPDIVVYFLARNEALLKHQMGLGEYNYIYYTAYYVALEKSPSDGPKFRLEGEGEQDDERYGETVFEDRLEKVSRRVNHMAREHLTNLKEMLDQTDPSNPNLPVIKKEISRLLGNRSLLPWRTGKPAFITGPFADYLQELDNSYKPLINPLEITEKE